MNNLFEYTGTIHFIGETMTFPSGFQKRTLVCVNYGNSKYPDYAVFDFHKDKTKILDGVILHEEVKVRFFLSGNENRNRPGQWFPSAVAMTVTPISQNELPNASPHPASASMPKPAEPTDAIMAKNASDLVQELPF